MASTVEKFGGGLKEGRSEKTVIYKKIIPKKRDPITPNNVRFQNRKIIYSSKDVDIAISDLKNSVLPIATRLVKSLSFISDIRIRDLEIQNIIEIAVCAYLNMKFPENSQYKPEILKRIKSFSMTSLFNDFLIQLNAIDCSNPEKIENQKYVVTRDEVFPHEDSISTEKKSSKVKNKESVVK